MFSKSDGSARQEGTNQLIKIRALNLLTLALIREALHVGEKLFSKLVRFSKSQAILVFNFKAMSARERTWRQKRVCLSFLSENPI